MKLPRDWVSLSPNGIGHQKPNHYKEMVEVAWNVRKHPRKAWKILSKGVCDGCALGVAGFHDWTLDGVHLCTTRLRLLEVNVADAFDHRRLADVSSLVGMSSSELRGLGRLAHPMRRRRGDPGFARITWDEALDAVAAGIGDAGGARTAVYVTSRGITNEVYYAAAKAARAMGVASIDSAARMCHSPSTIGLKQTIGVAAATCSMQDVLDTDLVVLWGTNVANNQPVFTKYLYLARKNGAEVVVVNPYLEPGLERYWVPSNIESAVFGTRLCDVHVSVRPEGDVALANALVKWLIDHARVDRAFVADHTQGWDELEAALAGRSIDELLAHAGVDRPTFETMATKYADARSAVIVWSMGITQHTNAVDGVRALVNVALSRGNVGRDGAGLMPIRGHSGVQGGAEMGAYATALPGGDPVDEHSAERWREKWGFEIPIAPARTAPEQLEAAAAGDLDVWFIDGSNLLEVMPDPRTVEAALGNVALRVHADIVVTSQMLVEGDDVILLPVATRYEQEGGGTSTTTERRIAFGPQVADPPGEAMTEWRMYGELAARVRPDLAHRFDWVDNLALRTEIGRLVPLYAGIEHLAEPHDAVQYGGRHLAEGGVFPTTSGRAAFSVVDVEPTRLADDEWYVSTRRGKQFNSMVMKQIDPLTGARRDAIYIDSHDAATLGIAESDPIRLTSPTGTFEGQAKLVRLPHRTMQVHWPEGNVLLPGGASSRESRSGIPDYNAIVRVSKIDGRPATP